MGSGISGKYKGTKGSGVAVGSTTLMTPSDPFIPNISRRIDVDSNGFYDVIAHGNKNQIKIYINGKEHLVDHRVLANMIKRNKKASTMNVRLLSCNTGSTDDGFAQNLANKLNITVKAPNNYLFAGPSGNYYVSEGRLVGKTIEPIPFTKGKFRIFKPRKGKK